MSGLLHTRDVGDGRTMMRRWWLIGAACALTVGGAPAIAGSQALAAGAPVLAGAAQTGGNVLLVCNGSTKPCPSGPAVSSTVQGAVDAARPGDWILIWPGVYHEKSAQWPTAGVWIQKPGLHIRGLNRNQVIIDGSNGTASRPCPSSPALQDTNGGAGRDGIVVWKTSGVTIQSVATFVLRTKGNQTLPLGTVFTVISNTAATPISGTFANLADGSVFTVGNNTFQVSYEGGDGNDLTLTVVP